MTETVQTIINRRSIRKYQERTIEEELVNMLLQAAMSAPSACNQQPWHFIVVTKRSLLEKLSECNGGYTMLKNAPLAILVCGEPRLATLPHFWPLDCAAASQNILLTAQAEGLGGVWLGAYPANEHVEYIRRTLNIPSQIIPFAIISLGYPDEVREPLQRFDSKRVHYNMEWVDENRMTL